LCKEYIYHIGEVEVHPNLPLIEMANHLGLLPSTLRRIMLSKEKITDAECVGHRPKKKGHEAWS
jgi:hypothetical protein